MTMGNLRITATVDRELLRAMDRWVSEGRYSSRSQAIETALRQKVGRDVRLVEALARIDSKAERELADEQLAGEVWLQP